MKIIVITGILLLIACAPDVDYAEMADRSICVQNKDNKTRMWYARADGKCDVNDAGFWPEWEGNISIDVLYPGESIGPNRKFIEVESS